MLSFYFLASPSFGLLAYLSSLFSSLPFSATFIFSAWVLHSLFNLPSILLTYISPPNGELVVQDVYVPARVSARDRPLVASWAERTWTSYS